MKRQSLATADEHSQSQQPMIAAAKCIDQQAPTNKCICTFNITTAQHRPFSTRNTRCGQAVCFVFFFNAEHPIPATETTSATQEQASFSSSSSSSLSASSRCSSPPALIRRQHHFSLWHYCQLPLLLLLILLFRHHQHQHHHHHILLHHPHHHFHRPQVAAAQRTGLAGAGSGGPRRYCQQRCPCLSCHRH